MPLFFCSSALCDGAFLSGVPASRIITAPMPVITSSSLITWISPSVTQHTIKRLTPQVVPKIFLPGLPPPMPAQWWMSCPARPFSCALRASLSPTGGSWRRARLSPSKRLGIPPPGVPSHLLKPSPPGQLEIWTPTPHYAESRIKKFPH